MEYQYVLISDRVPKLIGQNSNEADGVWLCAGGPGLACGAVVFDRELHDAWHEFQRSHMHGDMAQVS